MPSQTQAEPQLERMWTACAALLDAARARRVSVWAHDQASSTVSPLVSVGAEVPATRVARRWSRLPVRELGGLASVLDDRRPVLVEDVEVPGIPTAVCRDFGMSSAWVGPLGAGDQVLGLLVVEPLAAGTATDLDDHIDAVAAALSEARAWYLADRRQAELDLPAEKTSARSSLYPVDRGLRPAR